MRRKAGIFCTAFLMILLTSCVRQKPMDAADIVFDFSCKTDVTADGRAVTCSFCRMGPEDSSLQILTGVGAGLGYEWNGDGFTMTCQGLAAKSSACVLPDSSFESVLMHAVDAAAKPGGLASAQGGEFCGKSGSDDFTLTADPKTGRILTLSVPGKNVSAEFYAYEAIQS